MNVVTRVALIAVFVYVPIVQPAEPPKVRAALGPVNVPLIVSAPLSVRVVAAATVMVAAVRAELTVSVAAPVRLIASKVMPAVLRVHDEAMERVEPATVTCPRRR